MIEYIPCLPLEIKKPICPIQLFRLAKERFVQMRQLSANHKPGSSLDCPLERLDNCLCQSSKGSAEEVGKQMH